MLDSYLKLTAFFTKYKLLKYKKHEILVRAEEEPRGVYYLNKGYLKEYAVSEDGYEFTSVYFRPNDCFPLPWAIHNIPHLRTIEALTSVEIYKAPKDEFLTFIKQNPDVVFILLSRMSLRLSGVLQRMEYIVLGNAKTKVASIIYLLGNRFGVENNGKITIQVPLTQHEIATLVGLARETVSIEMEKLKADGIISYKGKQICIEKIDKLTRRALIDKYSQFA